MPLYHKVSNLININEDILVINNNITALTQDVSTNTTNIASKLNQDLSNLVDQIPIANLDNAVLKTTNQDISGLKHFQDNSIRLANNYRFNYDTNTENVDFLYDNLSSQKPIYTFNYNQNTLDLQQELVLKTGSALNLNTAKDIKISDQDNELTLHSKTDKGFKLLTPDNQTRFKVEYDSNNGWEVLINGTKLATESYVTSLPVADIFKYALINGGLSSTGLSRNILNPITIEQYQHPISNPNPIQFSENTNLPNTFTINCRGDFYNGINLNDIPVYANAKYIINTNKTIIPQLSQTSTCVLLESTDTFTRQHDSNSSVLPNAVYKVKATQVGASSQGGHSGFSIMFDLIVGTAGNTSGTPIVDLSSSNFFTSSHHGIPKITLEVLSSSWKVYLTFDHINGSYSNDSTTLSIQANLQDF